jgi:hypothetical protein
MSYVENILESIKGLISTASTVTSAVTTTTADNTSTTTPPPPQFIKQAKSKKKPHKTSNQYTNFNVFYI